MKDLIKITKTKTILYVEDESSVRIETTQLFNDFFYKVIDTKDGLVGLEAYKNYFEQNNKYFDLVITDITMPNMDGVELVSEIYKINKKQNIIVVSAYTDEKYLIPLIKLGISDFIKKPIVIEEFVNILNDFMQMYWNDATYITDNCHFDGKKLVWNDEVISITKNEILLLNQLLLNSGKYITLKDIHYSLYFNNPLKEYNPDPIRAMIKRLRKKLPDNCIINNRTLGYTLTHIQ